MDNTMHTFTAEEIAQLAEMDLRGGLLVPPRRFPRPQNWQVNRNHPLLPDAYNFGQDVHEE